MEQSRSLTGVLRRQKRITVVSPYQRASARLQQLKSQALPPALSLLRVLLGLCRGARHFPDSARKKHITRGHRCSVYKDKQTA